MIIMPSPVKPIKFHNYFIAECKKCGWDNIYRGDCLFIPEKCPKCRGEVFLRKAKLVDICSFRKLLKILIL